MKISELINELQTQLKEYGDLPIYHTIQARADVEIDSIQFLTNKICLANKYLDNYTLSEDEKLKNIENEIKRYAYHNDINCKDCKWYHFEEVMNYCLKDKNPKILVRSERFWKTDDKLFNCFVSKDKDLDKLLYYRSIILKNWKIETMNNLKLEQKNDTKYPFRINYKNEIELVITENELENLYEQIKNSIDDKKFKWRIE